MNYNANTIHWRPGDLVLHDADAKIQQMLMVVLGYDRVSGECKTKYVNPNALEDGRPGKRIYRNWINVLHDPGRFGIAVPNSVVKPEQIIREGINTTAHAEIFNYVLSQDRVTCSQIVEATRYDCKVVTTALTLLIEKGFLRLEMVADEPVYFVYVKP